MASVLFMLVLVFAPLESSASTHASTSGVDDCKNGACTAQIEIDDATAMIQSKAKISLDGQISVEDVMLLTKSTGVGHFLEVKGSDRLAAAQKMESSMETAVTKMIDGRGRALPSDIFASIDNAMEELKQQLVAEKDGFETEISNANGVVAKCNTNKHATSSGGVATAKGSVDDNKKTHHACREAELFAYDAKTTSCDALASKTKIVADAAPNCNNCQSSGLDTTSDVLTCLANNRNWKNWHEKNLTTQQLDCNTKTTTWSNTADACDTNQSNYEVAVCIYAEKLENMCSTLDTCYNEAKASRTSLVQSVEIEEKHLKAVLASAKKIVCYLSILKKSDTNKITHGELDVCLRLDVFSDKTYLNNSVHDLNITYTPADDKTTCQELNSTPGDGKWAAEEYKQYTKEWLRETAVCSHKAQGTSAYVGCLARPNGWRRPYGNVGISRVGAEACRDRCRSGGYTYFGLECPMGTEVHCQCSNSMGGTAKGDEYCEGNGNPLVHSHNHCKGPYTVDGYRFGDYSVGSVYRTASEATTTIRPRPLLMR